jgi:hypothetical protein
MEFPKEYCMWIWKEEEWEVDQENRWQDEVSEDGRIVGGEEWQEKNI